MTMMSTMKEWQDDYFTMVKKVEEPVLKFAGERAETFAKFVPERPSFLAQLPTTAEFVDNQLKFRKRFVDEQAAFARKMMKAMDPMLAKVDRVAEHTEAPAKPAAARMASRRATAKAA
jgi:hypothetical protein